MLRCFVIQPFDKGPFDKRYEDVLSPAIKSADLEPYRVDRDFGVNIPIESIETGIQGSSVCLADITEDNPNVWFEVGYAIAARKNVVFICSQERQTKFPFDVQHRTITKYSTASPRDFKALGKTITERLKAIRKSTDELGVVSQLATSQKTEGLAPHEVAALVIVMEHRLTPDAKVLPEVVRERMRSSVFTDVAVGIALNGLNQRGYIEYITEPDDHFNSYSTYVGLTDKGLQWIQDNQHSLVLKAEPQPEPRNISDEDIPF
jgi:hypothetical protein